MLYEQAIEYLYNRINYERAHSDSYAASDLKLERMRLLLDRLGNLHESIPAIHVAGTKGKGSVCSMVAAMLTAAGRRVGLYTSPHISAFEERIAVDGRRASREEIVGLVRRLQPLVEELDARPDRVGPTYFELATAMAWLHFADKRCDVAVLETGLGGRLDSTNVCRPVVTAITNVSRDHMHLLGSTVRLIAIEKAGIIKPGVPMITTARHPDAIAAIQEAAAKQQAPLWRVDRDFFIEPIGADSVRVRVPGVEWCDVRVALRGSHQQVNAGLAIAIFESLRYQGWAIDRERGREGLSRVVWPGRIERLGRNPEVYVDAAHNWASIAALLTTLREGDRAEGTSETASSVPRKTIAIFAGTRDKDVTGLLRQLLPAVDTLIVTRYLDNPRSACPHELAAWALELSGRAVHVTHDPGSAWQLAKRLASPADRIMVTGSFFLLAELRDRILQDCEPTV